MNTLLITGATGNLGSRILVEFLLNTKERCVLLVYAPNDQEAEALLTKTLTFWDINSEEYRDRIQVWSSDMTKADLGLSHTVYTALSEQVTHTIHCAAAFKLDLSIEDARRSIVTATQHLVALSRDAAVRGVFKRFNYISSLDAAGTTRGTIKEEFFTDTNRVFLNTYQQAKAEAETYLHSLATVEGFPITVYRPSMLVGDSKTGKIINPQSLYHIIHDMFLFPQSKILPGKSFRIDPMPIDVVARSMREMYSADETRGGVFHFVSGYEQSMTIPDFVSRLQKIYFEKTGVQHTVPLFTQPLIPYILLTVLTHMTWGKVKTDLEKQRDMVRYFFLDMRPENVRTKEFLASRSITIPPLTEYLATLCEYIIKTEKAPTSLHNS